MKTVKMYTDGACSGNPGPGGYAAILQYKDNLGDEHIKQITGSRKNTTNNRMELQAVIEGLKAIKYPVNVQIYSDSKYVTDAFNKKWIDRWVEDHFEGRKNQDLWIELLKLIAYNKCEIEWIWVKGHADNKFNNLADKLAVECRDSI